MKEIWVISENIELAQELASGAREMTGSEDRVIALILGGEQEACQILRSGVDLAYCLEEDYFLENIQETLLPLFKPNQPGLILVGATRRGKDLAAKLSAL